ncbi:hypothetical protein KEM52_001787, partial [Ascosphaera acerosa]
SASAAAAAAATSIAPVASAACARLSRTRKCTSLDSASASANANAATSSNTASDHRDSLDSRVVVTTSPSYSSLQSFSSSLDEAAWSRAVQRRQVLRELLDTEAAYVVGLKALADALSTYIPTRTTIHRSTLELLALHQRFLGQLRSVLPRGECDGADGGAEMRDAGRTDPAKGGPGIGDDSGVGYDKQQQCKRPPKHRSVATASFSVTHRGPIETHGVGRYNQHGGSPKKRPRPSRQRRQPVESLIRTSRAIAAPPLDAAKTADLLRWLLPRLDLYEDYGVTFQIVQKELDALRKSMSPTQWQVFDHGIEALVRSVAPDERRLKNARQGFTLEDMLMKPIQRVCKYQLFLAGLLKCTPVIDDPLSHAAVDAALQGMLEVNQEINRVTGDAVLKDRIYKTLLLRERLAFSSAQPYRDVLREFGPLNLCGVLHVAYQTGAGEVQGEYMLTCLFETHFTNFTFKIVFPAPNDSTACHELVLTACSDKEACQWIEYITRLASTSAARPADRGFWRRECAVTSSAAAPVAPDLLCSILELPLKRLPDGDRNAPANGSITASRTVIDDPTTISSDKPRRLPDDDSMRSVNRDCVSSTARRPDPAATDAHQVREMAARHLDD